MPGYTVGPTLPPGESPFAPGWEQDPRIDDGHPHVWETVLLGARQGAWRRRAHRRVEEVVRCQVCKAPRCGTSVDPNPCMERRHHRGVHVYLDGSFEPVGGLLPEIPDDAG